MKGDDIRRKDTTITITITTATNDKDDDDNDNGIIKVSTLTTGTIPQPDMFIDDCRGIPSTPFISIVVYQRQESKTNLCRRRWHDFDLIPTIATIIQQTTPRKRKRII